MYGQRAAKDHDFKQIEAALKGKNADFPHVVLLYGKEAYLIDFYKKRIAAHFVQEAARVFDSISLDGREEEGNILQSLQEACETLPLLSERRVVLVEGWGAFGGGQDTYNKKREAAIKLPDKRATEDLLKLLEHLPETCLLLFTAQDIDGRNRVVKKIKECGAIYEMSRLERGDLSRFVAKELRLSGIQPSSYPVGRFIELTGYYNRDSVYDLFSIKNDVAKLAALAADTGGKIGEEELELACAGDADRYFFHIMNAIENGKNGQALQLLGNAVGAGERGTAFALIKSFVRQFEQMVAVSRLKEQGYGKSAIAKELGVQEFAVQNSLRYIRNRSSREIARSLSRLYACDSEIKSGLLPERLALELFVSNL